MNNKGFVLFTESFALKAVSILLALILWITILSLKPEEKKIRVPLEPLLPVGTQIINSIPNSIEFNLEGPRIWLSELEKRVQPIQPDLRKTRDTTIGLSISEDLLGELPTGVKVLSFYPTQILIRLDEMGERYIPIKPNLSGSPGRGFQVKSIQTSPSKVAVSGPLSVLESLEAVGTQEISIEKLKGNKDFLVGVEVDQQKGLKLSRESQVKVRVKIEKVELGNPDEELE